MQKHLIAFLGLGGLMIAVAFSNCSNFESIEESGKTKVSNEEQVNEEFDSAYESELADTADTLTEEEEKEVIDQIPESDQESPRPLSDAESDPSLFETYKCPYDVNGVVICHFPVGGSEPHTVCVPRAAVAVHADHGGTFTIDGEEVVISDYFGPCR